MIPLRLTHATRSWRKSMRPTALAGAATLLVGLAGCADYAENSKAQYVLLMTGINDGSPLESDVRLGGSICPDFVSLRVENHSKNPAVGATTGFRGDMVIERYEVTYFRSDGRNTQGVDVPYSITGNVAQEIQAESDATLNLEVVRRQAKVEPPLSTLVDVGGGTIVTMFAEITLHARMTTGEATNPVSARLQIDFADFADSGTASCPTP
jgi:hypothetical protein